MFGCVVVGLCAGEASQARVASELGCDAIKFGMCVLLQSTEQLGFLARVVCRRRLRSFGRFAIHCVGLLHLIEQWCLHCQAGGTRVR